MELDAVDHFFMTSNNRARARARNDPLGICQVNSLLYAKIERAFNRLIPRPAARYLLRNTRRGREL